MRQKQQPCQARLTKHRSGNDGKDERGANGGGKGHGAPGLEQRKLLCLKQRSGGAGSIWIAADNRQKDRQGALPGQAKKRAHQRL
jgi:hypothetical protein